MTIIAAYFFPKTGIYYSCGTLRRESKSQINNLLLSLLVEFNWQWNTWISKWPPRSRVLHKKLFFQLLQKCPAFVWWNINIGLPDCICSHQIPCFINMYKFYNTTMIHYNNDPLLLLSVILLILIICNFSKHKNKTPWGRCRTTETCRSTYKIVLIHIVP